MYRAQGMPSNKTFRTKVILAKANKQNRSVDTIEEWRGVEWENWDSIALEAGLAVEYEEQDG